MADWMKEEQAKITDVTQEQKDQMKYIKRLRLACAAVAVSFVLGGTLEVAAIVRHEKNNSKIRAIVETNGVNNSHTFIGVKAKDNRQYTLIGNNNEWLKEYSFYNEETKDYALLFPPSQGEEMYYNLITGRLVNLLDYSDYSRLDLPQMMQDGKVKMSMYQDNENISLYVDYHDVEDAVKENAEDYIIKRNYLNKKTF